MSPILRHHGILGAFASAPWTQYDLDTMILVYRSFSNNIEDTESTVVNEVLTLP